MDTDEEVTFKNLHTSAAATSGIMTGFLLFYLFFVAHTS
jgi:hypothetical protein